MLPVHDVETIAAVSTASGRSGIGIVRVSGPLSASIARGMLGVTPPPRFATRGVFRDAQGREIDSGLCLFFRSPNSYTGEDVLELHAHGNPLLLTGLLGRCCELGARQAEPGEFTKRAFLNGKLDLAQAEGVSALIEAKSLAAARSAMRSLSGEFSKVVLDLKTQIIDIRTQIEGGLDFPDDELDLERRDAIADQLREVSKRVAKILNGSKQGRLLIDGARVTLLGRPNVGKSSIMNRLSKEDISIVTDVPGTTRDALRETIRIGDVPVILSDTAGIRETTNVVEVLGVERAMNEVTLSDLVLIVTEAHRGLTAGDLELAARIPQMTARIWVRNKIDLLDERISSDTLRGEPAVSVSAKTGEGIEALEQVILEILGCQDLGDGVFSARERHLSALRVVALAMEQALSGESSEIVAEHLRRAQGALGAVVGEFTSDDLLGEIFSRFCIGK